jgi:lipoprotein-anchoring transpeptidase ErfK/SrfK
VPSDLAAAVRGDLAVSTVVADPGYTFDPRKWPEVIGVDRKLAIPPGPRSPVGTRWIGLDRAGVGIHGVPEPGNIGKTGSHGCFRLTNWDAAWLAAVASPGMPVRICDRSPLADALVEDELVSGRAASARCRPEEERSQ